MTAADRIGSLYSSHFPDAVRLAFLLTGDRARAEDVAQDAFIAVSARIGRLRDPDRFAAYLRTAVVRRSIDTRRADDRRERRNERVGRLDAPDHDPIASVDGLGLRDVVADLPERQRAMVVLRYWADLSVNEIAELLRCPPGTVKSGLSRALDTLRKGVTDDQ